MQKSKMPVKVVVTDEEVMVSLAGGSYYSTEINNPWLWVLGAICNPDEYKISVKDQRKNMESHQKQLTTD